MIRLIALIALLGLVAPARADDVPSPELTEALQQCIEAVNDSRASDDGSGDVPGYTECIGVGTNACQSVPGGDSTIGMVDCNTKEQTFWDDMLNNAYGELEARLDADAFAALKQAQEAWIPWRDAKCEAVLAIFSEGSIRGVIYSSCLMETTAQRAVDLMDIMYQM
jgi:uncharacterized protein YecT (DUF1311 family)